MASNDSKDTPEHRKESCRWIIGSERSATKTAKEMGTDENTACSWVRGCRRQNQLPACAEEKGIRKSVREEDAERKDRTKRKTHYYRSTRVSRVNSLLLHGILFPFARAVLLHTNQHFSMPVHL